MGLRPIMQEAEGRNTSVTDTKTPNDNLRKSIVTLVGLTLLFALGMIVGLLLVKNPEWLPRPIAHFLSLDNVYPTQGLIGPQKIIHGESASRP